MEQEGGEQGGMGGEKGSVQTVEERVEAVVTPLLESMGLELVDVEYGVGRGRARLCLYVDKPGGVTIDDLSAVSREAGVLLDVEDPIEMSYDLEVSSPGLSRPLRKEKDFRRAVGKRIRLVTTAEVGGRRTLAGTLEAFAGGVLTVVDSDGVRYEVGIGAR
ncbi:MAG TPA: ribosome maturation factor RimP [Deltaproteobacteria bacterium]|nr:ribosome maturation factor RimP [Deltaproteobacteria bacterium]